METVYPDPPHTRMASQCHDPSRRDSQMLFVDSGLALWLTTGVTADGSVGGLIENFVLGEIAGQPT